MSAEDSDNFDDDMDLATGYDDSMNDEPLFWSMTLEANKDTDITEPAISGYIVHITNACFGVQVNKNSRSVVMVNNDTPICTLIEGKHENQQLDLLFNEGATINVKGNKPSTVYLTGYTQPPIDREMMDPMAEDMTEAELQEVLRRQAEQQKMYDDEDDNKAEENEEEEPQLIDEDEIDEPPSKKMKTSKGSKSTSTKNGISDEKKRKSPLQKPKPKPSQIETETETETETNEKEKQSQKKSKKNKKMQNMKGGIKYRDMKVGSGDVIKNGDKVSVFYVGQTDDKQVFDKSISGNGFEFTFGSGDVKRMGYWFKRYETWWKKKISNTTKIRIWCKWFTTIYSWECHINIYY
eukprot:889967_1